MYDAAGESDLDSITYSEFTAALHQLLSASCCASMPFMAQVDPKPGVLGTRGFAQWRETITRKDPLVSATRGRFMLPDVDIVRSGREREHHVDVFIDNGKIKKIAPAGQSDTDGFTVIGAARKKVVASALVDMHTHLPPDNALKLTPLFLLLHLRYGVTQVRDAGDLDGTSTPAALAITKSGALPGPCLHYADAFVTAAPVRWSNSISYDHPEQAPQVVERLKHAGASWIKSYENLDVPRLRALVAAGQAAGLGTLGHVPSALTFEEAQLPDAQHLFGVPRPGDLKRDTLINRTLDWENVDDERLHEVVEAAQKLGLANTPTLVVEDGLQHMNPKSREPRPKEASLLPGFYADIVWNAKYGLATFRGLGPGDYERARAAGEKKRKLIAMLEQAGAVLRLGTDTQQPYSVPGASLHRELDTFEAAGISRERAWHMATVDAGAALGVSEFGTLREGAMAECIVCDSSPLDSEWSPDAIYAVVAGDALIERRTLDEAIRGHLRRFRGPISQFATRWLAKAALARATKNFVP